MWQFKETTSRDFSTCSEFGFAFDEDIDLSVGKAHILGSISVRYVDHLLC
jgi:hypothetical protein